MNKYRKTSRLSPFLLLLALLVVLIQSVDFNIGEIGAAPTAPPDWTTPITITTDVDAPDGANFSIVSAAPDSTTVMVVYNRANSTAEGDNDPYFSRSLDNGETWSTPEAITETTAVSSQVHMDYDANGVAHVVWQEDRGLAYANEGTPNGGAWADPFLELVAPGGSPGVTNPFVVASDNNLIDVVWSEGTGGGEPDIYHARSRDGGSSWPVEIRGAINSSLSSSQFPAVAVDQTGGVHVVWQDPDHFVSNPIRLGGTIFYSKGTDTGAAMTWSTPIEISQETTLNQYDTREPEIIVNGSRVQVVYTEFVNTDAQSVYYLQCASQCTDEDNWTNPVLISGQLLGANGADPLNVASAFVQRGPCATTYFHGTADGLVDNEIIWGVNSCEGWSQSARDQVTSSNFRSINPSLAVQNNVWLYLTYEQGVTAHQIYFHRELFSDVYLPIVLKK